MYTHSSLRQPHTMAPLRIGSGSGLKRTTSSLVTSRLIYRSSPICLRIWDAFFLRSDVIRQI